MISSSRKIIVSLAAIGIALGIMLIPSCFVRATGEEKLRVDIYDNEGEGEYARYWAEVMCSYLTEVSDGYQIVCVNPNAKNNSGDVKILTFGTDFTFKSIKTIKAELPRFGGFFDGSDGYYLVWGQSNLNEDDSCEVIRIVKYDKNWKRINSASLYGAYTYIPFDAGTLRMTECDDYLYIRTCHKMYASSDGLHHQANLSIQVKKSEMRITDSFYRVSSGGFYCSHSFNQFVIVDDNNNVIALDHGDAYPRSAFLVKSTQNASNYEYVFNSYTRTENAMTYYGKKGENFTGAILGGLEYSDSNYLTVGASVDQSSDNSGKKAKNVYVSATGREAVGEGNTRINWITDYTEDSGKYALDTKLVKIDSNKFLVIWSEYDPNSEGNNLKYVFVNGAGNTTSDIYSADGSLSDCQPVLIGNKVMWYVSTAKEANLKFCSINTKGEYEEINSVFPSNADLYPKNINKDECRVIVSGFNLAWNSDDFDGSYYDLMYEDRVLIEGEDYIMTDTYYGYTGQRVICVDGIGDFYGSIQRIIFIDFVSPTQESWSIEESQSSVAINLKYGSYILGYVIERKVNTGDFIQVADIPYDADEAWTDNDISVGNKYTYRIRAYTTDGTKIVYSNYSGEKTVDKTPTPTPTATPTPTKKPTVKPTATPTPAAKKSGWKQERGSWYYYNTKGSKVTSWQQINGAWYFFDSKGVMQTGWVEDGNKWYFMNASGAMTTGWIQSGGKWYYMGLSGAMATGWIQDGKNWYYLSSSGAMATGWIQSGGKWYFMSASGAMATGWVKSGNTWYYMSASGAMVANGWVQSGKNWYYFDASGAMVTGEFEIEGKKSKFSSSGAWIGYA